MPEKKSDYYAVLGIFRDATQDEIKHAYFERAQRLHPDKNLAPGETELFLEMQQAYEVLSNPKRRALYDATLPPDIEPENPVVKHQVSFSRTNLVQLKEPQLIYMLLEVGPRDETERIPAPPLNVCLVLDRSTSMQGEKMDMVKAAAIQLIRSLRPQDVFSVVTFSDRADVVVQASLHMDRVKQEGRIQMIKPSGSTEILQGLEAGIKEIRYSLDSTRVSHLILLTDGHTYGDEQACLQLAEEAARQNIGISGMGIGEEWNDIFLDALAGRTGNSSAYISNPKDIQRFLVEKFQALASTFADEVTLEYKPSEGVDLNYAFRMQPDGGPVSLEQPLQLGPILQDAPLQVLCEFIVQPNAITKENVLILDGQLKTSIAARPTPVPPIRLRLSRDVRSDPGSVPPPTKVLSALSRLTLYRMQERARAETEAGNYDVAARQLHNLATHLLAQGEQQLAKTALLEADHIERMHAMSAAGNKAIKYQTRALLLAGSKEKAT
jgi:Ca-activated chloride channel family protein